MIFLGSCADHFTLIGAVNLGSVPADAGAGGGEEDQDKQEAPVVCFPRLGAMETEIKGHGYTPNGWAETTKVLRALTLISKQHPVCP